MQEYSYEDIAGLIDQALLHPTLTEEELFEGCQSAIFIKPPQSV